MYIVDSMDRERFPEVGLPANLRLSLSLTRTLSLSLSLSLSLTLSLTVTLTSPSYLPYISLHLARR